MTRTEILKTAKPIPFNDEMVRAILDGRKAATRRPIKVNTAFPKALKPVENPVGLMTVGGIIRPQYQVGDYLYVRETWATTKSNACIANELGNCPYKSCDTADGTCFADEYIYKADDLSRTDVKWHPSIHMPKKAARIFLRVINIFPQLVKEITEEQALQEGFSSRAEFISEFLKIYPSCTEDSWAWAINFEKVEVTE